MGVRVGTIKDAMDSVKYDHKRWKKHKHVQGISAGMQHAILMGFVDGRGQLAMGAAKEIASRNTPCRDTSVVKQRIYPELTKIKNAILSAMGAAYSGAESPFEYDENVGGVGGAWVSHLSIGVATVEEGDLCFIPSELM
jgi:hypothetical protein